MDEKQERHWRRKTIRLWLRGHSDRQIQQQVPRSLGWIHKWQQRYTQWGWQGLKSQSRQRNHPSGYSTQVRQIVCRLRRQLAKRKVGRLIGARAIQREIRRARLLPPKQQASQSTIKRILRDAHLTPRPTRPHAVYHPHPTPRDDYIIQAMDWASRYLEGGAKVYAFHSLDLAIHDLYQTISDNKRGATAEVHALKTLENLGLPHAFLIDNDAAWCGSLKTARYFSHFMRLALWLGIELIFIPLAEAEFNGAVERVNGLWSQQFWNLRHFDSRAQVRRCSPQFVEWYRDCYEPPHLGERTPAEARRRVARCRLTATQCQTIPTHLPLTAGRIHFIRLVDPQGDIHLLHETWHVDQRLAGQYVWATITLHEQRLRIYHRRSAHDPIQLRKIFRYSLAEPVTPLQTQFKRFGRRRNVFTMW